MDIVALLKNGFRESPVSDFLEVAHTIPPPKITSTANQVVTQQSERGSWKASPGRRRSSVLDWALRYAARIDVQLESRKTACVQNHMTLGMGEPPDDHRFSTYPSHQ